MPRILWFALGAIAGTAYASSLIHKERLDQSRGEAALEVDSPEGKALAEAKAAEARATKEKLAERLEEGAIRVSGFIEEKAHLLADRLRGTAPPGIEVPAEVATRPPVTHAGGGGGSTAHEVLESPFPQTDPGRPAAPILRNTEGKPPVMLDVTADQGGMEDLR